MKVFEEILKREEVKGIAIVNKEGEIVFKGKEGEFFQEAVGIIGSAGEASLKNIGVENFSYIKLYLKDGSNIYIIKENELYIGIKGEEIDIEKIIEFIKSYKEKVEIEKEIPQKEEVLRKPEGMVERFVEMKTKQINALIREFSEGDEIRWGKVVIAKIKDTSPIFAEHLIQEGKEIKVKYPISPSLNEEEINRCFRAAIDIIWKMAVSKYGVEEARKRVKMVSDKLRES